MRSFFTRLMICGCLVLFGVYAAAEEAAAPNTLTPAEKDAGWKLLFDGKSTDGWRNYKKETIGGPWKIVDGALTLTEKGAATSLRRISTARSSCRSTSTSRRGATAA